MLYHAELSVRSYSAAKVTERRKEAKSLQDLQSRDGLVCEKIIIFVRITEFNHDSHYNTHR